MVPVYLLVVVEEVLCQQPPVGEVVVDSVEAGLLHVQDDGLLPARPAQVHLRSVL